MNSIAIVGAGRMGTALVRGLAGAAGPFGRGFDGAGFDVVVLAVPDDEIAVAAASIAPGRLVGHCAGSLGLDVLAPHEAFAVHPLMTVTTHGADFRGAGGAVAGSTSRALQAAHDLADALGLRTFEIADDDRAAYHAAASMASNFLVTLEDAAEALLASTGGSRDVLLPIVRATVENWAELGGPRALTGPIARGDEATVERQRAAIAARLPEFVSLFDAMCDRTRALAARQR